MQSKLRREREIQRDYVASLYDDFSKVRAIAEKHLRENPNVMAIWLFGSRARGNATQGRSAWDLGVITADEELPIKCEKDMQSLSSPAVENDILSFEIPVSLFRAKRTSVPHRACLIAAEGIPLAERNWQPQLLEPHERLRMDLHWFQIYCTMATAALTGISQLFDLLADLESNVVWYGRLKYFIADSQNLAESLIKCGFIWREVHVCWSHECNELADAAEAAAMESSFVDMVRRLEGAPVKDQGTRYEEINANQVLDAAKRIELLCSNMPSEFVSASKRFRERKNEAGMVLLDEHVRVFNAVLPYCAHHIRNARKPQSLDPTLVRRVEHRAVVQSIWQQQDLLAACFEQAASQLRTAFSNSR